jgi:hypothetical protein
VFSEGEEDDDIIRNIQDPADDPEVCYICIFYYLILLLMPLAGLHFCVGSDFVTPSL